MKAKRNLVAWTALAVVVFFFGYSFVTALDGPTRELTLTGTLAAYAAAVAVLATMFVAGRRAYRSRRIAWLLMIVVLWPMAFVYALAFDRGDA